MSCRTVDDALLAGWSLPRHADDADKEERGRVLVIAGSAEMPGAAVLAATAALRAGAGKLAVATTRPAAATVAAALPEARVIALAETDAGGPHIGAFAGVREVARHAAAILVGPGMLDAQATIAFVRAVLDAAPSATMVLDALAMEAVGEVGAFRQPVILTPHPGEMAHLTGIAKEEIVALPQPVALRFAKAWRAVLVLKGATTSIADADGGAWRHESGCAGLGTSGSGDVLAGIVAGLAARGATPQQAAVWGVVLHARAGEKLAREKGSIGFLARELAGEVPGLMDSCVGGETR